MEKAIFVYILPFFLRLLSAFPNNATNIKVFKEMHLYINIEHYFFKIGYIYTIFDNFPRSSID